MANIISGSSGNPALSEKIFKDLSFANNVDVMTLRGTLNKLGFVAVMVLAGALFAWKSFYDQVPYAKSLLWIGFIGGIIVGFAIIFKKEWASFLAPAYGVLEGLLLGSISAMYNNIFAERMPNIIFNAVALTLGTVLMMFFLYRYQVIRATKKFKSVLFIATGAIGIFYLVTIVLRLFNVAVPFMHDSSPLGIGISLVIVAIAALNLIVDFDMIEQAAAQRAPKYMEWYGAFALVVTIVWLYLEILRLLSRFAGSRN